MDETSHQPGSYEQGVSRQTGLARSVPMGGEIIGWLVNLVAEMKWYVLIGCQLTM